MNDEIEYDVVIDALQTKHDRLWSMTNHNMEWGIMDHIRLQQMDELKEAMKVWRAHKNEKT